MSPAVNGVRNERFCFFNHFVTLADEFIIRKATFVHLTKKQKPSSQNCERFDRGIGTLYVYAKFQLSRFKYLREETKLRMR